MIKLTSNSIWCWLSQAVHGISKLDTKLKDQYTVVLTLSENTVTAIENRSKKITEYFIIKFKIYFFISNYYNNKVQIITAILRQT